MDIELPAKNILPHCTIPDDPEKKNSWLGMYIFYNDRIEFLSERKQQLPHICKKRIKELEDLVKKSKSARVIGVEKGSIKEDRDLAIILNDPTIKEIDGLWWFSRMITEKGCFGWEGCENPKLIEKDFYENIYESIHEE